MIQPALSVVVGVDASAASHAALAFALRRAQTLGCVVDVVTVWSARDADADREASAAGSVQDQALDGALAGFDDPPVISRWVVRGDPAAVLERASRRSESLILGRPSGSGSVARSCSRNVKVPLVLVPAGGEGPRHLDVVA